MNYKLNKLFKVISILLTIAGFIIIFLEISEQFPNSRKKLADQIKSLKTGVLPLDAPGVNSLLLNFLGKKYPDFERRKNDFKGIQIKDLCFDSNCVGTILICVSSEKCYSVCNYDELDKWVNQNKMSDWIGFGLAVLGSICGWVIDIPPYFRKVGMFNNCTVADTKFGASQIFPKNEERERITDFFKRKVWFWRQIHFWFRRFGPIPSLHEPCFAI